MDIFTDVDLMCDLMEASNKRRVPVYILLDEKNLSYFTDMCVALDIQNSHLNVSETGRDRVITTVLLNPDLSNTAAFKEVICFLEQAFLSWSQFYGCWVLLTWLLTAT